MALLSMLQQRKAVTSPKRSLVKTVTWRIIAELDTFAVTYVITGSMKWSLAIVGVESATKTVLYYIHERAWGQIAWGAGGWPNPIETGVSSLSRDDANI